MYIQNCAQDKNSTRTELIKRMHLQYIQSYVLGKLDRCIWKLWKLHRISQCLCFNVKCKNRIVGWSPAHQYEWTTLYCPVPDRFLDLIKIVPWLCAMQQRSHVCAETQSTPPGWGHLRYTETCQWFKQRMSSMYSSMYFLFLYKKQVQSQSLWWYNSTYSTDSLLQRRKLRIIGLNQWFLIIFCHAPPCGQQCFHTPLDPPDRQPPQNGILLRI